MHSLQTIRDVMLGELLRLADDRRAHRRRMVGAFAAACAGLLACAIATIGATGGEPPARGSWTTVLIIWLAIGLAAHERRCVRAIDGRMRALGRVVAPLA